MYVFFFFNDTATTEIYTLSLHDALPIFLIIVFGALVAAGLPLLLGVVAIVVAMGLTALAGNFYDLDRKSTRLNSSHANISYAVFCLKKKITTIYTITITVANSK